MHLVIDGYGASRERLKDPDFIYQLLESFPARINMTRISPPHVYTYVGPKPEDWGVSGFVLIAESHISIHTFPDRSYVNIDVFSCKQFDHQKALEELKARFQITRAESQLLERGLDTLAMANVSAGGRGEAS